VWRDSLDLLRIAEQGGIEIAWAAEHHGMEFWLAANPFSILADWAARTERIRLGVGVAVAPYWHPIRLAGESGLVDLFSDGRLELGIARGAFDYEFARMAGGLTPEEGRSYVFEMVPLLKKLWAGDVVHDGEHWRFPRATAAPKPLQKPHPPLWIAARDPASFDFALEEGMSIMSTPLSKPIAEVASLAGKLARALEEHPGAARPRWMVLRQSGVYERAADRTVMLDANVHHGKRFENLFSTDGNVINGFPQVLDVASGASGGHTHELIAEAMVIGTPEEVVLQLREYEALGVDNFCYNGCYGMCPALTRRSLELFVERVMPHFEEEKGSGLFSRPSDVAGSALMDGK
jgi:alkanesulfonate monooxygenase SsuD/methylene tetrahydromethanopterin reductase-like flavin-dependent oxidoreductase (luciferase family)